MTLLQLFRSPKRWTKGALARNKHGAKEDCVYGDAAACFCLIGGVYKCFPTANDERAQVFGKLGIAIKKLFPRRCPHATFSGFNDHPRTTIEDIRKVIRYANQLK